MNKVIVVGGVCALGVITAVFLRGRSSTVSEVSQSPDPTLAYLASAGTSPISTGLVTAADQYGASDGSYTQPVGDSDGIKALQINAATQRETTSSGLFSALSSMVTGGVSSVKAAFGTGADGKTTIEFNATPIPQITPVVATPPSPSTSASGATTVSDVLGISGGAAGLWDYRLSGSDKVSVMASVGYNGPESGFASYIKSAGIDATRLSNAITSEYRNEARQTATVQGKLSAEDIEAKYGSRVDIQSARNEDPNFNLAKWYDDFGRFGM